MALACGVGMAAGALGPIAVAATAALLVLLLRGARHAGGKRSAAFVPVPKGAVYLHGLASSHPGHGATLMREVVAEAQMTGRLLALDASNQALVRYYERFGFSAIGPPTSAGVRMVRCVAEEAADAVADGARMDVLTPEACLSREGGAALTPVQAKKHFWEQRLGLLAGTFGAKCDREVQNAVTSR